MKNRIRFLKAFDHVAGPLLLNIAPRPKTYNIAVGNAERILVIRPGGMGDAALLLPALKAVKNTISGIKIDVLCESRNAGIFHAAPYVDHILHYDHLKDLCKVFQRRYDIVFDTEQSHLMTPVLCSLLKANLRIGYATQDRERLYHRALPYDHHRYEAESFWDLFTEVLPIPESFQWDFPYFLRCRNKDSLIDGFMQADRPFICLFPGATIRERLWPESRWARIADSLQNEGYDIVLLGGHAELPICKRIIAKSHAKGIMNFSGKLSILESASLLEKAALLISTDSGILHVGVSCGTPTVSLFGSGIASKWGPTGTNHTVINKGLPCSPCTLFGTTPTCQNNMACMMDITSEEVAGACMELLNRNSERSPRILLRG